MHMSISIVSLSKQIKEYQYRKIRYKKSILTLFSLISLLLKSFNTVVLVSYFLKDP